MMSLPDFGWTFLIARGRTAGFRLLMAPTFILQENLLGALIKQTESEVPAFASPKVQTVTVRDSESLCIVYRSRRVTGADIEPDGDMNEIVVDQVGRPLILTFGFVCRNAFVGKVDERDLQVALHDALAAYRTFLSDEANFAIESSSPYDLHSDLVPNEMAESQISQDSPERRLALQTRPSESGGTGLLSKHRRLVLSRNIVAAVVALAMTAVVASQFVQRPKLLVPSVVQASTVKATQKLRAAGFDPATKQLPAGTSCWPGTVIKQSPAAGSVIRKGSRVLLTVCPAVPVTVPETVGLDYAAAGKQMSDVKLIPTRTEVASDKPGGEVIRTDPAGRDRVPQGTEIEVFVSTGKPPSPGTISAPATGSVDRASPLIGNWWGGGPLAPDEHTSVALQLSLNIDGSYRVTREALVAVGTWTTDGQTLVLYQSDGTTRHWHWQIVAFGGGSLLLVQTDEGGIAALKRS